MSEVMVRTYAPDGTFYKGGWTNIDTLWLKGYQRAAIGLALEGKCRLTNNVTGTIIEFIEV